MAQLDELRKEPMMAHLMDTLESGRSIEHYGRLVFAMVARHFMEKDEVAEWLVRDPECGPDEARRLVAQVSERGYSPPRRERILEWMSRQEFPICPDPGDRSQCNVYRHLQFPEAVYEKISRYYENGAGLSRD